MARGAFWTCVACGAQNHESVGTCQFCECEGAECRRDNCDDPAHPTCSICRGSHGPEVQHACE